MTPKEKAEELVTKMYNTQVQVCSWKRAKVAALIAVDEMMQVYASALHAIGMHKDIAELIQSSYLQQVKKEIEKL